MTTSHPRHVAVIDIGKTNAKLALVDLETRREIAALRRPNRPLTDGAYPHHDVDALWDFILDGLGELRRDHRVDAISVTTHGATAALVGPQGDLVLPVCDYEFAGPEAEAHSYAALRPPFSETGSPKLPAGLNLGAQLFWLQRSFPAAFARINAVLTWPQFWSWKLTGVAASEATSLGCHTDLWNPHDRAFSSLVGRMGWRPLFPPLRKAGDVLGPLLPEIVRRTGLDPKTPVICGIHDSNASLLPHLAARRPPFSVVSTGTWVVSMAVGGRKVALDPARDTLVNTNAHGDPVPSARFMGGREFELVMEGYEGEENATDLEALAGEGVMLMPSVVRGSGPFPGRDAAWRGGEPAVEKRFAAASFYLAMMTATCLDLVGAEGEIVVEGPFAANRPYLAMLASATGRPVAAQEGGGTGTSIGAALLAGGDRDAPGIGASSRTNPSDALRRYAELWRAAAAQAR